MARILLIDDEQVVRNTVAELLAIAGHAVVAATDGGVGLGLLNAGGFDLVLTDIYMPHVEGMETIQAIRRIDKTIPIIAMSGGPRDPMLSGVLAGFDQLAIAEIIGADATLRKPVTRAKLLPLIERCLGVGKSPA
ncbi:MAG: response regulator [Alphaproteobacteria bacterium]